MKCDEEEKKCDACPKCKQITLGHLGQDTAKLQANLDQFITSLPEDSYASKCFKKNVFDVECLIDRGIDEEDLQKFENLIDAISN